MLTQAAARILGIGMAVASIGLIAIMSADTETRTQRTPSGDVTDVSPAPNTIVPPQSPVVVDLRDDLIGALTICDPTQHCVAIPDDQVEQVAGRPVAFLQLADGSVLLSDDKGGRIYRISYRGPQGGR